MTLTDLLFSREERENIRHSDIFNSTNIIWNKKKYNSRNSIGTISYLTKNAHEIFKKTNKNIILDFNQWQNYYFSSGTKRLDLIKTIEEGTKIPSEYNYYYGRTLQDIYNMSQKFLSDCAEIEISLSEVEAFNFCYIRIIDEGYIGYRRELTALLLLKKMYPQFTFSFASDYDDLYLGIDILVYKKNKLYGGIQVKSDIYLKSEKKYNSDAKIVDKKRFERCKKEKNFVPKYVYITQRGKIVPPYPDLKKS